MRRDAMSMKVGRLFLALMLALATAVVPIPPFAHAEVAPLRSAAAGTAWDEAQSAGDDEIARWWGAVGAVLCGAEIRLIRLAPAIGMNPYVLAAGIGGCLLAALDIVTST